MAKSDATDSKLWDQELAANGRVEFATSKKRLWLMALGSLAFTGIGLAIVLFDADPEAQVWGWTAVVFFGVVCVPVLALQAMRTSVVVVDARGVRPSVGARHGALISWPDLVPWDQIEGTGANSIQGTRFVILYITDEFEHEWLAGCGPFVRVLMRANRAMQGTASLALPANLHGDVNEIADWIEGQRRMRRTRP